MACSTCGKKGPMNVTNASRPSVIIRPTNNNPRKPQAIRGVIKKPSSNAPASE